MKGAPLVCAALVFALAVADTSSKLGANVLVVYAEDPGGQVASLAKALEAGANSVAGTSTRLHLDIAANYERDVAVWADAVLLGSLALNGNAAPTLLSFINSFDFADDLTAKVGGAFATGGASVAGLQPVLEQLGRGMATFGMITVGGASWENREGTGIVTNGTALIAKGSAAWALGFGQGVRIAQLAAKLKQVAPAPAPPAPAPAPTPEPAGASAPDPFGDTWSASIATNMTQVGYDAGLVLVNFSGFCGADPTKQQMRTTFGDFYTVLTRCDLGVEYTIAPPSRNSSCLARKIGRDTDPRVCLACGCPFCVRDTNGTFSAGDGHTPTVTAWQAPRVTTIDGKECLVFEGRAQGDKSGGQSFDLETSIAYDLRDSTIPVFVNISHPLWISTRAAISNFRRTVPDGIFDVPQNCPAADDE